MDGRGARRPEYRDGGHSPVLDPSETSVAHSFGKKGGHRVEVARTNPGRKFAPSGGASEIEVEGLARFRHGGKYVEMTLDDPFEAISRCSGATQPHFYGFPHGIQHDAKDEREDLLLAFEVVVERGLSPDCSPVPGG